MLPVQERYYKLNYILLKVLGLWPYRNSKWVQMTQMVIITIFCVSAIFVQLAVFITHKCTMELILSVFLYVFPYATGFLLYVVHYFHSGTFKEIMEHIYYDWQFFKSRTEVDILDNYASTAKLFTEVYFFSYVLGMTAVSFYLMPIFFDVILPLNESRGRTVLLEVEYFFEPDKYAYLFITVHFMISTLLDLLIMVASGSVLVGYCLHACAVFKITNYRMEMIIDKDVLRISRPERDRVILDRLIYAVKLHRRNLLYCKMLMLQINRPFLAIIIISIITLSICLFKLQQAIVERNNITEIMIMFDLFLCHLCFAFFGNHIGQQLTNNNAEIFNTVYNLPWYLVSLNIQKVILFLLQKCNKDIYLSFGGIFDASYELFSTMVTTAISYFMMIYTVH